MRAGEKSVLGEKGILPRHYYSYMHLKCPRQIRLQRHTGRLERNERAMVSPVHVVPLTFHIEHLQAAHIANIEIECGRAVLAQMEYCPRISYHRLKKDTYEHDSKRYSSHSVNMFVASLEDLRKGKTPLRPAQPASPETSLDLRPGNLDSMHFPS